ncbi:hypothetical protein DPEC_G00233760 [Dallia pectoralis]|uniref:Uncharacterized protein n=1 Tax=Dallia pectoralis TaxID=75939 RepID=A0ACC2FXP9_DALPE|nr:hypothetical protein DPEC_G00233760 [Dallia pectoralis]
MSARLFGSELLYADLDEASEELTEVVCLESDLQDGQMMEVEVGRHNVLLAKSEGVYSATGNQCTHYGAPLSRGVLSGHTVRCPWHGSCFNIWTGDLEEYPGMDCLPCHKVMDVESDTILLRRMEFFQENDIEVWLSKEATSMDAEEKTVTFNDGSVQSYDQLFISTGCRAKGLECPGKDLENVLMLETPEDARKIHAACMGARIIIVGTSFVGMEVASYMLDKATSITVIGSSEMPYQKTLGLEIGEVTMMMLSQKGVKFYMNDNVKEVHGNNGKSYFPLSLPLGVIPNAEFLQSTPIVMDSKNFVIVDKYMRTNVHDVFCGGDLATFPLTMANNKMVNIGHWQMAQAHGRIAALNMLKKPTELNSIPYYWTVLLGMNLRYTGYGEGYTDIIIKGRVEEQKFLAFYFKNDEVIAAASLNYDPAVSAVAERLATGNVITKKEAEYVAKPHPYLFTTLSLTHHCL